MIVKFAVENAIHATVLKRISAYPAGTAHILTTRIVLAHSIAQKCIFLMLKQHFVKNVQKTVGNVMIKLHVYNATKDFSCMNWDFVHNVKIPAVHVPH